MDCVCNTSETGRCDCQYYSAEDRTDFDAESINCVIRLELKHYAHILAEVFRYSEKCNAPFGDSPCLYLEENEPVQLELPFGQQHTP